GGALRAGARPRNPRGCHARRARRAAAVARLRVARRNVRGRGAGRSGRGVHDLVRARSDAGGRARRPADPRRRSSRRRSGPAAGAAALRVVFLIGKALHGGAYRLTKGRVGGRLMGIPVLLLTTSGRRTGKRRTVPLTYFEDGDLLVVVGSKGGSPQHPDWYLNLVAGPEVEVQVGGEHRPVRARPASPEEAERLWPLVLERAPIYGKYRARTTREIPLVLLERDPGF